MINSYSIKEEEEIQQIKMKFEESAIILPFRLRKV